MEINVEVPDPEIPPVETPPAAIVVAPSAAAPEGTVDLAVTVGTLVAKVEQIAADLSETKMMAEMAQSSARMALEIAQPPVTISEPIEEVIVTPAEPSGSEEPAPKSKRHWLAEILL